jgi:integrase
LVRFPIIRGEPVLNTHGEGSGLALRRLHMYFQKRGEKYSFVYFDEKLRKNVRLRVSEVPADIDSDEKAEAFCRKKEGELEAAKIRAERRLAWKSKFYDFEKLLELYEKDRKEQSPNNFANDLYYMRSYVLRFFLDIKECSNINNWSLHFRDFQDWIANVEPLKSCGGKKRNLSVSTQNHCIKALNTFLTSMRERGEMSCEGVLTCQSFPKYKLKLKSWEDLISPDEAIRIKDRLTEYDPLAADFFVVLLETGLRVSEGLGLSAKSLLKKEHVSSKLKPFIEKHQMNPFAYLKIESQLEGRTGFESSDGTISRKPLKGKYQIDPENSRMVPVLSAELMNILVKRYKSAAERFSANRLRVNPRDCLLFHGLKYYRFTALLRKVCSELRLRKSFTPHECRHTFSTNFVGMTDGNIFFAQIVLGHEDVETTRRYLHLHEEIMAERATQDQLLNGTDWDFEMSV